LTKITTPDVIGTSATVVAVSGIFITISGMAIQNGLPRFVGKSFARQENEDAKLFVKISFLLTTVGILASCVFIFVAKDWVVETFSIDISLILIIIILVSSSCYARLFRTAVVSTLKTKMLPISTGIATIAKILVAVVLLYFGAGSVGILIGFVLFEIFASILLAFNLFQILKTKKRSNLGIFESIRNLLAASVVSWIPALIMNFGVHLGTIIIFGTQGASQAGVYFIAFSISTAIWALLMTPWGTGFPKLSAMEDRRKRFAGWLVKIGLIVFLPLLCSVFFYSEEILLIFGESYAQASLTLQILLISNLPLALMGGIRTLTYAYGNYNHVLIIGIAMSIPRILLYFILVPDMGDVGAGISFTIGSLIGFIASIIIAKKIGFIIFWKEISILLVIPVAISWFLSYFEIHFLIGIPAILILSYISFLKIGIITKIDLHKSVEVLPKKIGQPTINFLDKVAKKLHNTY